MCCSVIASIFERVQVFLRTEEMLLSISIFSKLGLRGLRVDDHAIWALDWFQAKIRYSKESCWRTIAIRELWELYHRIWRWPTRHDAAIIPKRRGEFQRWPRREFQLAMHLSTVWWHFWNVKPCSIGWRRITDGITTHAVTKDTPGWKSLWNPSPPFVHAKVLWCCQICCPGYVKLQHFPALTRAREWVTAKNVPVALCISILYLAHHTTLAVIQYITVWTTQWGTISFGCILQNTYLRFWGMSVIQPGWIPTYAKAKVSNFHTFWITQVRGRVYLGITTEIIFGYPIPSIYEHLKFESHPTDGHGNGTVNAPPDYIPQQLSATIWHPKLNIDQTRPTVGQEAFYQVMPFLWIKFIKTTVHQRQANGQVQLYNQTLVTRICPCASKSEKLGQT